MSLFRVEVGAAHAASWLGGVRLHRPLSFTWVTIAALALAMALVAFAAWGDVYRKARLTDLLVPTLGSLNITVTQSGVLLELPVAKGQTVAAGDVLMVLATERRSMQDASDRAALQIEALQQSLATERTLRQLQSSQREQALNDRIRTLQSELQQAAEETTLAQRRVQLARTTLERNEQLATEGFVAAAQVQTRQEELIDANARLQRVLGSQTALQPTLGERKALNTQLDAGLNQLERSSATLTQEASENVARKSEIITAPSAGTAMALNMRLGQSVTAGQTLAALVPIAAPTPAPSPPTGEVIPAEFGAVPVRAHLFAPSHTADFVRSGQKVYLRYAAYPCQKFGPHTVSITSVSATPFAPSELPPIWCSNSSPRWEATKRYTESM